MSFEKKLYDYEVNPPQLVWDKLSSTLDELHLENSFKKKLKELKTEPPIESWERIEKDLNAEIKETIPVKLYNITETPPSEVWNKINEQLADDDFTKKFSDKLATIEVTPPPGNWRKIAAGIETGTPVISIRRRYSKPLRYAAAAIVIGLMAWGGFVLFNNSKNTSIAGVTAEKKESNKKSESTTQPVQATISNEAVGPKNEKVEPASDQSQSIVVSKPVKAAAKSASVTPVFDNHSGSDEIIANASLLQSNKEVDINNTMTKDDAPRYLVYMNEKGSLMKVSKKLADLTCIYTKDGEVSQNALAKLDRVICNDMVSCWQEKLALTPINLSFNPLEMADVLNKQ